MRLLVATMLGLLLAAPAMAQQGLGEQLRAAETTFLQGLGPGDMADGRYYDALAAGLAGTWVARRMLTDTADLDAGVARACAMAPTAISTDTPLSLTIADGSGLPITYAYLGGVSFAPLFDLGAFLKRQSPLASRADLASLARALEHIAIYRPSPDVLVLARALEEPLVFLRCGGATPASAAPVEPEAPAAAPAPQDEALAVALGRSFDTQFKAGGDPAVRAQFIVCAAAAMQGLSAADLDLLVSTNFQPANEELARIRDTYPAVSEGARDCAEAANKALAPAAP